MTFPEGDLDFLEVALVRFGTRVRRLSAMIFSRGGNGKGVFAFACQCIVSPRGRTGNRTVTQMRHPLLVEGRPNCARQALASTVSAPRVAATSHCDPGCHTNVITPCLLTPCLLTPCFLRFVYAVKTECRNFFEGLIVRPPASNNCNECPQACAV